MFKKENNDGKDDYITISQESRQEKAKVETYKFYKYSFTKYPDGQNHWIKQLNLCWSHISR